MLSAMLVHIDEFNSFADSFDNTVSQFFGFAHYGYNKSVMVFVFTVIEQLHVVFSTETFYNFFNFFFVAPFTEIRDALHDFVHNIFNVFIISSSTK
ncbi:hypothetical protein SDC9_168897 [bioreactor metagenome]|uniref:Uncharacterized protein n=1 Tax=bioreactor metagenome TaxID=1076179 RepID=A0A645G3P6_9ZZZZ